ncbi:MAG TPA: class I SAM-dependent methyltransferase [Acidimicrobiia bacterium]|nr:class I SAM-dependent methyltransferase [Acidimicrobiia bacterium]
MTFHEPLYRMMATLHLPKRWVFGSWTGFLEQLLETGTIKPGQAIDLGCGAGEEAVYLAENGFDVTGIDISPTAIRLANRRASSAGMSVRFQVDDLTNLECNYSTFDVLVDIGTLNDIDRSGRDAYVHTVRGLSHAGSRFILFGFGSQLPIEEREARFGSDFTIETLQERTEPLFRRRMITSLLVRR